jgi:hypothetical protein
MSSNEELGQQLEDRQRFSEIQRRYVRLDENRIELQIQFGGNMIGKFQGTVEKGEWENDPAFRQSKNFADAGGPADPNSVARPDLIKKQAEADLKPGAIRNEEGQKYVDQFDSTGRKKKNR